ncbi:MAG: hypothetical protein WCG86_05110 [Actinomycetota bacterium]
MEPTHDLLTQLRIDWRHTGSCAAAIRAYQKFSERHPELELERASSLADVVFLLEARGGLNVEMRAAIVSALLSDARDPLLARTLLQTLLPGLVSVCRQLRFGEGIITERGEAVGVAIALLAELIYDWAGQSRQYAAPDILSALRGRFRRWLLKEKVLRRQVASDETFLHLSANEFSPLLTRLEAFIGTPHERIARLMYQRIFDGTSISDLADRDATTPYTLRKELQWFATRHLV